MLLISLSSIAQEDSTKYIWYKFQYGSRMPRFWADSVIHIPYGDTASVKHRPQKPGAIMMHTDKNVYKWDSTGWRNMDAGSNSNNLQQVTDNGPKTNDTIIAAGLMTKSILNDTLDEDDFEIDVFPDLQKYNSVPNLAPEDSMFKWVVDNKVIENIQGVLQPGDITDFATSTEFSRADVQFDKLDAAGIPYLYVPGNHDYDGNVPSTRLTTEYNTLFGPSRYTGMPWYGGNMDGTNDNYFIQLDVGSHRYLIIGLEFCPRDTALNWAQKIIDSIPNRETIIVTHAYIARSGERSTDSTQFAKATYSVVGNNGDSLWTKLIQKNKQIFLVLNGHFINPFSTPVIKRITEAGLKGNVVYQLVCNYQEDPLGGNGYFMRLKFRPRLRKIDISFYSPYLQQYDTRFPAYSIDYPAIAINGPVGFSATNGSASFAGEVRFDSTVSFTNLLKNRFAKITDVGRMTTDSIKIADITNIPAGAVPFGGTNNQGTTDALNFSFDNTNNRLGVGIQNPFKALDVRFSMGVSGFTQGYPTLLSGIPAQFYVTQGGGSWGQAITRHDATSRAPNLVFFTSQNADPTVYSAIPVGKDMARISFHGVTDASVPKVFGDFVYRATNVTDGVQQGQYLFSTGAIGNDYISAPDNIKMLIDADGNVSISKNPTNVGFKLWVNGNAGIHKDSTKIITSITTEFVLVQDTVTHELKRIRADSLPGGGGGTSYTFTSGLTEAAGTVTNDLITGISGGQTIIGSTSTNSGLNIRATSAAGTTGSNILFQVGNNGATEAMRILHDGKVGILTGGSAPVVALDIPTNNTTNSLARFGSIELQSYQTNNAWMSDNSYFDGTNFVYRNNGTAGMFRFNLGSFNVYSATSGTAGNPISWQIPFTCDTDGDVGLGGITTPTAKLHLPAGTAAANTAPLKFESGTNLTTPENGTVEYDGTKYYATSGGTRYELARVLKGSVTHDFGTIGANSSGTQTLTVTGAALGDPVTVSKTSGAYSNGENYDAFVSSPNTVTVRQSNGSGGSFSIGSVTLNVALLKY